jgi:hypothetical protein
MDATNLVRIKVQRAREHIRDLEIEVRSFLGTNPYRVGTKRDPQTRRLIYYLVEVRPVPERIGAIVGDVLQNLRSALDHLAYQLFRRGPGITDSSPAGHVYFPISDDAAKHQTGSQGKVHGMGQDAIDAIDATRPYKGGNDALWHLHKLNNIDKHRFVITVGTAFCSLDLGAHAFEKLAELVPALAKMEPLHAFFKPGDRMFPLKVGDELFIDAPDAKENQKMQFRFEVAFGEPGIAEGEPLLETLQSFADFVDHVISDFAPLLR